ncbi:MAG: hypothetical protein JNL33_03090 [Betaproteobacteria bacterium]|nr:hypothetical protein [Betaproteobacteria bacterium]
MRYVLRGVMGALVAAVTGLAGAVERVHRYTVTVEPELRGLVTDACFAGTPPEMLVVESLDAPGAFVEGKAVSQSRKPLAPNGTELKLKDVGENGCIQYRVSLVGNQTRHDHSGNSTRKVGQDLFTELGLWFWRPAQLGPDEDIEISFRMPEGYSVSTPWRPVASSDAIPTYRVGRGAYDRPAAVAFGKFKERLIEVPGSTLRVAILDGNPRADPEALSVWIEDAARSVAAIYGRFPVPSPQVLVMPGARASEPTPWAYVLRGGQAAVHFFVNQRRPLSEYVEDWTASHELSHLFLPYINSSDAWLSEGLATYYQNVTRARSGAVAPAEAWQRMHAGFKRGRDKGVKEQTLAMATERMFREGGYMRVYWHGTAILLQADVELRRRSGGEQSLDTVLEAFGHCCLDPDVEWTARKVFEKFDAISGTDIFATLYAREVNSPTFPDLRELYALLGLDALGGKLTLRPEAPLVGIRDAIMAPGPYRTPEKLLASRP